MIRPTPGLMGMLNQTPVEFMYLVRDTEEGEEWVCKPLFVANPVTCTKLVRPSDRITLLHSQCR